MRKRKGQGREKQGRRRENSSRTSTGVSITDSDPFPMLLRSPSFLLGVLGVSAVRPLPEALA